MSKTLNIDHVTRIEGHGNVNIVISDGQIETVEVNVTEPARLFESMVKGRIYHEVPYISSRICGICSPSHVVTDLMALEKIFELTITERTSALRELLIYGSYIQNHATHLFVFAAPDYVGASSVFPLADSSPELYKRALELKALGNELCTQIGGRSVHPITAVVGGFTREISNGAYLELAEKLESMIEFAQQTVDLFDSFETPSIETDGEMLAMVLEEHYPVECSEELTFVRSGESFESSDYTDHIEEYSVSHSNALLSRVKSSKSPYMTSALSRVNASWQHLGKQAKIASAKAGLRPPEYNPFMNNVAQAVELVDALDRCASMCRSLASDEISGSSEPVPHRIRGGRGVGFTEAPRGTLFHDITLNDAGRVVSASIITPTAQNVANLENDLRKLVEQLLLSEVDEGVIKFEAEKLVRAYDPCLSCSVH